MNFIFRALDFVINFIRTRFTKKHISMIRIDSELMINLNKKARDNFKEFNDILNLMPLYFFSQF